MILPSRYLKNETWHKSYWIYSGCGSESTNKMHKVVQNVFAIILLCLHFDNGPFRDTFCYMLLSKRHKFNTSNTGLGNRTLWKCAIALFNVWKKCNFEIRTFCAHLLFSKELLCDCTLCRIFEKCEKSAITHTHIFKEQQNVRSHIRSFIKSDKKVQSQNRSFEMSKWAKMC